MRFNIKSRSLGFEGISAEQRQNHTVGIDRAIYPIFAYSDNINGGNLSQTIQVGDFTFVGSEETRAKSGIIVGGGIYLGIKKQYGRGRYADVNINASLTAAPAHDWLKIRNESLTVCSKNHVKEWRFFDICASWSHNKRQFSDVINKSILASFSRLFVSGKTFNETSLAAKRFISKEYQQMQGIVTLNSMLPNGFKTHLSMTAGEPVKDFISLNYSLGIAVSRLINKKSLKLSFNQTFYNGGSFLGIDREDKTQQISVSYPVYKGFNLSVGYTINESSINSFSHSGPLVSISLPKQSF